MKIYFKENKNISSVPRKFYADWIKPVFPKNRQFIYGIEQQDLQLSENPEGADTLILPLTWNYYFEHRKLDDAIDILKQYDVFNKPIITWVSGDYTHKLPDGNFIVLQHNLFRSTRKNNEYAYPAIIRDPFDYLRLYGINIKSKNENSSISFCGVANSTAIDKYENILKEFLFKIKNMISKPYLDLSLPISGMKLRGDLLKSFDQNSFLKTNIIIRKRSDSIHINKEKYKFQYWNNMLSTPFTLCVRGNGNFSVRFYEALAIGRIPVLFDTDCILPLDDQIDWKKHCIIVKNKDLIKAVKSIELSINAMDENKIIDLQMANRKLWIENLSFGGFYYSFNRLIKEKIQLESN